MRTSTRRLVGSRLRIALVVAVALAASVSTLVATSSSGDPDRRSEGDAVAPSRAQRPAPAPAAPREWRVTPLVGATSQPVPWVLAAFALTASGLVGRRLRRIGDNGDDWRSLLEGAPPAVA